MPTLLHLDSSADLTGSRSRAITAAFVSAWTARGTEFSVIVRDLSATPLPAIPDVLFHQDPATRPADSQLPPDVVALQTELLDELFAADALLIGAPMYNYTIPASLKAWFEFVHIPGLTFGAGTQPLAGRPAVVAAARGGAYDAGSPTESFDHALPLLELLLGTMMGMNVTSLISSYTLAESAPALAEFRERSRDEFERALVGAAELATTIC